MTDQLDQFETLLHARHSCRAFLPTELDPALIERITLAAARVPSWCNAQPWQLIVTRGAETGRFRQALLAEVAQTQPQPDLPWPEAYEGAYGARRKTCGLQLYKAVGVARGDGEGRQRQTMQNFRLFEAPHVAIVTAPKKLGPYGAMDCGGFVSAFCLAAEAAGVASIPQAAVAAYAPLIRQHFGLEEERNILCAISFGMEDKTHPANSFRTERAPLAEVLDWRG